MDGAGVAAVAGLGARTLPPPKPVCCRMWAKAGLRPTKREDRDGCWPEAGAGAGGVLVEGGVGGAGAAVGLAAAAAGALLTRVVLAAAA